MISIIIPSYNSENTIGKCLDSLIKQSFMGEYEIILVDSSVDSTPKIVAEGYPKVKLVHLIKKTDPGTARNIGINEAQGELIAFIDSDCVAARDWLEKIKSAHRSNIRVVGGVVMNGNEEGDLIGLAGYIAEFREFIPGQPKREVTHIPTCNISYKKEIFRNYGVFRKEYYPQEDLFFNYHLWVRGEKILFDPAIQVFHHQRSKLREFLNHQHNIGETTSKVLKEIPLEGSFIVRHPRLAVFLIPFLPIVKFIRTLLIFLRYRPTIIARHPLVLVVFTLGLGYWVKGFARGIFKN